MISLQIKRSKLINLYIQVNQQRVFGLNYFQAQPKGKQSYRRALGVDLQDFFQQCEQGSVKQLFIVSQFPPFCINGNLNIGVQICIKIQDKNEQRKL
ncbi:hypothetical protein pb186bvf_012018 [Paramecium bursaria]